MYKFWKNHTFISIYLQAHKNLSVEIIIGYWQMKVDAKVYVLYTIYLFNYSFILVLLIVD